MVALRKFGYHGSSLKTEIILYSQTILILAAKVTAATRHYVAKPSIHHSFHNAQVYDGLFFSIINTGKFGLFRLFIHNLHLFDNLCRNIFTGKLGVIEEKSSAVNGDFLDFLTICCDRTIRRDFNTGETLENILKGLVVGNSH